MAFFLGLYLGHILGDFVFQPGRLVIAKRERPSAAALHSAIVAACTALTLAGVLGRVWPAVALVALMHFGVEQLSIRARRSQNATGLAVFLLDQGLHVTSLAMIALLAGDQTTPVIGIWPSTPEALATLSGLVTVAFAGSILVFEVQLLRGGRDRSADPVLGLDAARVYGMAERAAALAAALVIGNPLLAVAAFAPRLAYAALVRHGDRRAQFGAAGVGLALTAVAWVLVTMVTER